MEEDCKCGDAGIDYSSAVQGTVMIGKDGNMGIPGRQKNAYYH